MIAVKEKGSAGVVLVENVNDDDQITAAETKVSCYGLISALLARQPWDISRV